MSLLEIFNNPPSAGQVTVLEKNSELVTVDINQSRFVPLIADLDVPHELMRSSRSKESARSAFLESPEKRLWHAWYEQGFTGVLEELTNDNNPDISSLRRITSRYARYILWIARMVNSLHGSVFPHLAMSNEDLIAEFSRNASWKDTYVRAFAWHPHAHKFAVALHNDFVSIHAIPTSNVLCDVIVPTLKHKMQKGVADLAWKPLSASVLALACQSCVLIWTVDPQSLSPRPSTSNCQVLSTPGHCPVISVAWSSQEGILVSASPTDNSIMVWDVALNTCTPIRRVGDGGVTFVRWSPDGSKLFTACPTSLFRVWQCISWTCEKWTNLLGRCREACWSPDGSMLLFATTCEPIIYSLTFTMNELDGTSLSVSKAAINAIDVSAVNKNTNEGVVRIGGIVQTMAWDSNAERLAIVFEGSSAAFVVVFQTRLRPFLDIIPCGFIRGRPDELASIISFKPNFVDGALLTVVWSSGRIAHIPFYYTPSQRIGQRLTAFDVSVSDIRFSSPS